LLLRISRLLLVAWLVVFVYLTLVWSPKDHPPPNLIPFQSMRHDWREGGEPFRINLVGNIAAFLPAGFLLPRARRRATTLVYVALCAFVVSGLIECAQFASGRRTADVDDVVLNVAGALLGFTLGRWLLRAREPDPMVDSKS
jgi:glycopeptide antibiotics resistance protein